jgi:glycopeptide antibiotics resistance protein
MLGLDDTLVLSLIICGALAVGTYLRTRNFTDTEKKYKAIRTTIILMFVFYSICLLNLLFFKDRNVLFPVAVMHGLSIDYWINLVPFETIMKYLNGGGNYGRYAPLINIFGNLAAFAPMGFFLPVLFKKCRKFAFYFITIMIMILAVESIQLFFRIGFFDVDDIILNSAGAFFIWFVFKHKYLQRLFTKIGVIEP